MSTKRYYWFKMPDNFFNQIEIKMLRKVAGGDTFVIIYLKLLLISLKNNGQLFFEGFGNDVVEEVSLEIDEDLRNVEVTLNFLKSKGLMREVEADVYELQKAKLMVGSESSSAERKRRQRERERDNVTKLSHHSHVEIEIEIEKRREDIDKENKNICASNDADIPKPKSVKREIENATVIIDDDNNVEIIDETDSEFNELWKKYPNKKGKSNALKAYRKHRKKTSYEEIKSGLEDYINHIKINNIKPQFIKHGSTWFNQESWNDDYTVIRSTGNAIRDHWDNI